MSDGLTDTTLAELLQQSNDPHRGENAVVASEHDYLCVRMGTRAYAVPAERVVEVIAPLPIAAIPHTPRHLPGIINRHGKITAILDYMQYVGDTDEAKALRIMIVQAGELSAGLPVTKIFGMMSFPDDLLQPPLPDMQQLGDFIQGHIMRDEQIFLVLNIESLLESTRLQRGDRKA